MSDQEQAIISKVSWRLIPFVAFAFLLCHIDRNNLGFAALTMNKELGFTATVFGWGAGIFFVGYCLFEVPSNLALRRFGARRWIARVMISWGLVATCMALVSGKVSFLILRFLLGVAEAGFFPGIVFYLSQWFPERHRAVVLSRFIFGQPLALLISAALSGVILKLNGILGIAGWKWLFLIEGLPTVIIGFVTLFYLPDSPAAASWLAPSERKWLQAQIDDEHNRVEAGQRMTLWQALSHPKVIALGFVYMGLILCQASTVMFLPLMLKGLRNLSSLQIGFIAAIPYVSASIGMLIIGYSSDRARERKYHLLFSMLLVGTGSLGAALFHSNFVMTVLCVSMVTIGYFSSLPIFWMLPSAFLTGAASAGGIALISSVGNMGGFIAQTTMGWLKDLTGDYRTGLMLFASAVTLAAIVAFLVWLQIEAQRKNRNKSGECYKKATSET